jgi:hypothetical protein
MKVQLLLIVTSIIKTYYGFNKLTRFKFHLQKNEKYEKETHS